MFFNSKSNCVRSNYPFFVFKNKQNTSIPELDAVYNLEVNQFYFVECLFESFYKFPADHASYKSYKERIEQFRSKSCLPFCKTIDALYNLGVFYTQLSTGLSSWTYVINHIRRIVQRYLTY